VGWGDQTAKYLVLINKSVDKITMDHIMTDAKADSHWNASAHDILGAGGSADADDERANIGFRDQ